MFLYYAFYCRLPAFTKLDFFPIYDFLSLKYIPSIPLVQPLFHDYKRLRTNITHNVDELEVDDHNVVS